MIAELFVTGDREFQTAACAVILNALDWKLMFEPLKPKLRPLSDLPTGWRRSVVVSALASINVVSRHWARLVLGWVTACGRVHHLGM